MLEKKPEVFFLVLGHWIPAIHLILLATPWFLGLDLGTAVFIFLFNLYLLPPILSRLLYGFKIPEGRFSPTDSIYKRWWLVTQLQSLYLRFPFLEEILRSLPMVYSNWLRLWGSKIGKNIFWSPSVIVIDRTHLEIGDFVAVGFGAGFTSHHFNQSSGKYELLLAKSTVESKVVLGGQSGVGPGSVVREGETLPATHALAPFYEWSGGRRRAPSAPKTKTEEALPQSINLRGVDDHKNLEWN